MTACIYKISNIVNGKFYIGSTNDYERRHQEHLRQLKLGIHHNLYLQRAFNKYGEANFSNEIILEVKDPNDLLYYEQVALDNAFKKYSKKQIYNTSTRSDRPPSHNELSAEKQASKILKLRNHGLQRPPFSEAHRKKISKALTGLKRTDREIELIRERFSKDWVIIRPTGEVLEIHNMNAFIKEENARYNINLEQALLNKVANGERTHHLNYQVFKKEDFSHDKIKNLEKEIIRVKDPNGNILEFTEWRPFCREHNLDRKTLKNVLIHKKGKQHKGYTRIEEK